MAVPRVFISSTCYDLSEVRDRLVSFCDSFGFESVLSENGDIFYDPNLHTHEACIKEVSNCNLFILIIGGRYGGILKGTNDQSITNAEYKEARKLGLPVFTFIKREVLNDHLIYQKNRDKDFVESISYPSIEKQTTAKEIFSFINDVRLHSTNNGFSGFQYAKDIEEYLRKQFAGMFFDFLTKQELSNQLEKTNDSVDRISIATKKIEDLLKNVYLEVGSDSTQATIDALDDKSKAVELFASISRIIEDGWFIPEVDVEEILEFHDRSLNQFLCLIEGFVVVDMTTVDNRDVKSICYEPTHKVLYEVSGQLNLEEIKNQKHLEDLFEYYKKLDLQEKRKILKSHTVPF